MTLADEDYLSKVLVEVDIVEQSFDDSSVTTAWQQLDKSILAVWQQIVRAWSQLVII